MYHSQEINVYIVAAVKNPHANHKGAYNFNSHISSKNHAKQGDPIEITTANMAIIVSLLIAMSP